MAAAMESSDSKQALAEQRTETAQQRTLLAEERTYSAWVRTGLAAVATGFALVQLMDKSHSLWLVRPLGLLFIVGGGVMFVLGYRSYRQGVRSLPDGLGTGVSASVILVLSASLLIGAILAVMVVVLS